MPYWTDNLIMAAGIVVRCENLFEFAREGPDHDEPKRRNLQQVLERARIREEHYPRAGMATKRFTDDPNPTRRQRRLLKKIPGILRSL